MNHCKRHGNHPKCEEYLFSTRGVSTNHETMTSAAKDEEIKYIQFLAKKEMNNSTLLIYHSVKTDQVPSPN